MFGACAGDGAPVVPPKNGIGDASPPKHPKGPVLKMGAYFVRLVQTGSRRKKPPTLLGLFGDKPTWSPQKGWFTLSFVFTSAQNKQVPSTKQQPNIKKWQRGEGDPTARRPQRLALGELLRPGRLAAKRGHGLKMASSPGGKTHHGHDPLLADRLFQVLEYCKVSRWVCLVLRNPKRRTT